MILINILVWGHRGICQAQEETINFFETFVCQKTVVETEEQAQERCKRLLNKYQENVIKRNVQYRAGIAQFLLRQDGQPDYDLKTNFFRLQIEWRKWANLFGVGEQGTIQLPENEAEALLKESQTHSLPVFIVVDMEETILTAKQIVLIGLGKEWIISLNMPSISEQLNPKPVPFQTSEEQKWCQLLSRIRYNRFVLQYDSRYLAGVVNLNSTKWKNDIFSIEIQWQEWAKNLFHFLPENQIEISAQKAEKLWDEGKQKPIFVLIDIERSEQEGRIIPQSTFLFGIQNKWEFKQTWYDQQKMTCEQQCNRMDSGNEKHCKEEIEGASTCSTCREFMIAGSDAYLTCLINNGFTTRDCSEIEQEVDQCVVKARKLGEAKTTCYKRCKEYPFESGQVKIDDTYEEPKPREEKLQPGSLHQG